MLLTELAPSASKNTVGCVLVVEDELIIQEAIALALREEGYSVLLAEDGYNALQIAKYISSKTGICAMVVAN